MSAPGRPQRESRSAKHAGSTATAAVNRREFIGSAAAAGAFVLGFPTTATAQGLPPEVNAWVVVKPDETVLIRIARSEMGQGTLTGLAQLVAEELGCDWTRVTTEYPTPGQNLARQRVWGNFSTGGSRGIRESHEYVRKGGAAARMMLVQAAADGWGVPAAECRVDKGVITHPGSNRRTTYGQVAVAAAKLTPPAAANVALKDAKDWTLTGQRLARLDTVDKTNGKQVYGADLQMPGLLNAAIAACPVFGGKLKSFDAAKVNNMPGVKKVLAVGDNAVAVVADTWWRAKKALDALPVQWDLGPNAAVQQAGIDAMLKEGLGAEQAAVGNSNGDVKTALAGAKRRIEAVYAYPHQNHATMEPMNATAKWTAERCEVWTPTQNGEAALAATAAAAGLPPAQCEVYKIHLGGGFGRRGAVHDWVRQAVLIAKEMPGTPVKLLWSREEDMTHGLYHPITQCKLTAGLDDKGQLTALHMRLSGQSILAGLFPQNVRDGKDPVAFQGLNNGGGEAMIGYGVPNLLIDHAMRNPHVPPGFWRGVNLNQNTIYLECFLDEIAHATGQDPLALRRTLMKEHPKHLAVLEAAAQRAGWGQPAPDVRGQKVYRGLAQTHGFGSYVAACAEVSVSAEGELTVHRIVAATDPGHAVNPQQIEAQVEGSFVYGLSAALYGACTVKDGAIVQKNFDTYPAMRLAQMPKVETITMPSGGFWGGVGEPTIAVAAPAVLNAIFAATGKRIRTLPLSQHSLKRA
ncbi:MAG: xanthine dehydrogenase family protein molybdopterin-binding subunit [Rubrivivax sp.]|nr:xanthine dehydrogenase family protein molybdopterin-binding subunit [Rubrivivax sp.]